MLNAVKKFFTPPRFPDDDEKTRLTEILHTMIIAVMFLVVILGIGVVFIFVKKVFVAFILLFVFCISLIIYFFARRGYLRLASFVYVYFFWSISTLFLYLIGGTSNPLLSFYIAITVTAGILLGVRWAVIVALQSVLVVFIITILEIHNYYFPKFFPLPPLTRWFNFTVFLLFTIIPVFVLLNRLSRALKKVQRRNEQRKNTEKLLKESERKYREIANNIPGLVFQFTVNDNRSAVFTFISPSGRRLFDIKLDSGSEVFELSGNIFHEDRAEFINTLQKAIDGSAKWRFEGRLLSSQGEPVWVQAFASPTVTEKGTVFDGILLDITEHKQLEEQYRQVQKMEALGLLAGGIAHDFNNILTPIMGYLDLTLMSLVQDDKIYSQIKTAREEAKMAAELTRQILAFSRKQVLEMRECDLNKIVSEFENMARRLIGEDIELVIMPQNDLYPVKADTSQIEQVIMNLTVNARDAMPSGGKLIVETANKYLDESYVNKYADTLLPGNYVMLALSDTGHGMDRETQQHIFEPFYTTKADGKGTGLGLSTVFGIIKQHGGNISVYSEPGEGTTFKIYLPAVESSMQGNTDLLPKEEFSLYGSETVIVIEDKESLCNMIYHALSGYGYNVIKFQIAEEAIRFIKGYKSVIDLLLTDVIMPEMNGREIHQKISEYYPGIKVLYISGYTDNVIAHHGILEEGVNFLQKPFSIQNLLRKVRMVLD